MKLDRDQQAPGCSALHVYLLGTIDFAAALALQRRLHFDISGNRTCAALILCEHPTMITMGRRASRAHILCDPDEIAGRGWSIRWVNRGGGAWLHGPGQLAVYPIVPLDRVGLSIAEYVHALGATLCRVLDDFSVRTNIRIDDGGVWAGPRLLAGVGVAVKDWVTYHGACFNLNPDLSLHRLLRCHPSCKEPMTSLERERRGPVRPALVRERLIEHFQEALRIPRISLFSDHPVLHASPKPTSRKVIALPRDERSESRGY